MDRGYRVLLVDCDPRRSLTSAVGLDRSTLGEQQLYTLIKAVVDGTTPDARQAVWILPTGEHIIPANLILAEAEIDLQHISFGAHVLVDLLAPLLADHDFILLDCPPSLGQLLTNALIAANQVLVPLTPEYLASQGFERLMSRVISRIQSHPRLNPQLQVLGVVLTMVKPRSGGQRLSEDDIAAYAERLHVPVLGRIRDAVAVADAPAAGYAVTRWPVGNGAANDYSALATTILEQLGDSHAE